ncbi:hypothetical protein TSMEX_004144 [Taenia solium]|eukprot:TsM_001217700 transcript=TsM_001217700 gene=TsM_001217700
MRRHQEMRKGRDSGSTATQELNNADDLTLPPTSVPIVCVQCDSSVEAEEEDCERALYRVRSFKRTSKGLISLGFGLFASATGFCVANYKCACNSSLWLEVVPMMDLQTNNKNSRPALKAPVSSCSLPPTPYLCPFDHGDSFRSSNTSNYGHPFHTPRCSTTSAIASLGRHSRLSESYAEAPNLITQWQERHSTANALVTADSESRCSFSHYKPTSPAGSLRPPSTFSLSNIATPVKVQILGGPTVGKTMLCRQFLTAEFVGGKTESCEWWWWRWCISRGGL